MADESNVLAAVEFALGIEGMSRDMRCEHCHKETVIPLSVPKKGEERCVKKNAQNATSSVKANGTQQNTTKYRGQTRTASQTV